MSENSVHKVSNVLDVINIRGYYIELKGSPVSHYIFIAINVSTRTSYICGEFDLYLN